MYYGTINVQAPPPRLGEVDTVPAFGDCRDDNLALQIIADWLKGRGSSAVVLFPPRLPNGKSAQYYTSKPLRFWTGIQIAMPGGASAARISPTDDFDWQLHPYWEHPQFKPRGIQKSGDIHLVDLWNDATARGTYCRIDFQGFRLNGRNQPGSKGLLAKLQQPAKTNDLRIENFEDAGQIWGQESHHGGTTMFIHNKRNLRFGNQYPHFGGPDAKMHEVQHLNVENHDEAEYAVLSDCEGPNFIRWAHLEMELFPNVRAFNLRRGSLYIDGGLNSSGGPVLTVGDKTPLPSLRHTNYRLGTVTGWEQTSSDPTYTQLLLDDRVRGQKRYVGLQRVNRSLRSAPQNDTQADFDATEEIIGNKGGYVRTGGVSGATAAPEGHSAAQQTIRPNSGDEAVRWLGDDDVNRMGINHRGELEMAEALAGPIFLDRNDGKRYRLKIDAGVLGLEPVG